MEPLTAFAAGFICCAVLILGAGAILSRNSSGPDPERRTNTTDRRRRHKTALAVNQIAEHYHAAALTYPQASTRLREIEVPVRAVRRVLKRHTANH